MLLTHFCYEEQYGTKTKFFYHLPIVTTQVLRTNFTLEVYWDGGSTVNVYLDGSFFNMTCGLCGNFNGDPNDDFMNPDGILASRTFCLKSNMASLFLAFSVLYSTAGISRYDEGLNNIILDCCVVIFFTGGYSRGVWRQLALSLAW